MQALERKCIYIVRLSQANHIRQQKDTLFLSKKSSFSEMQSFLGFSIHNEITRRISHILRIVCIKHFILTVWIKSRPQICTPCVSELDLSQINRNTALVHIV